MKYLMLGWLWSVEPFIDNAVGIEQLASVAHDAVSHLAHITGP